MSQNNHHQILHNTMQKIATRIYSKGKHAKEMVLVPEQSMLNKRHVKNALTRNSLLSISEKLNIYKSYEQTLKHDREAIIEKERELTAKLIAVKPPLVPKGSIRNQNKNMVVNKSSFVRKTMFIEKDKVQTKYSILIL